MFYWVKSHEFSISEVKILMDSVRSSKFIPEGKTEELLEKLVSMGGGEQSRLLRRNAVKFQTVKHSNEEIYETIENIERAVSKKRRITFLYFDLDIHGERVYRHDRKVYKEQPLSMLCDDGNYYLLCYTEDEDCDSDIKAFRLDRMASVKMIDESISEEAVKALKSVRSYPKQVFKMYGGKSEYVRLEFDKKLLGVMHNKFGENIRVKDNGDTFAATVRVQISPTFWGWLTGFMGKIKILSPEEIKSEYIDWLTATIVAMNDTH